MSWLPSVLQEVVAPTLQEYASRDKVCVIYHEYPLSQHRYAPNAARYCEAAYLIGRNQALKVMDALFSNQDQWSEDGKIEAVLSKAISKQEFAKIKSNLREPSIDQSIRRGIALATASGVRGTPTMFVYYSGAKQKVENPQQMSYPIFKEYFDRHSK